MLAPMSGVTDIGMRRIARRFGATLVVTEMVACENYLSEERESMIRAEGHGVAPHVVQLVGREPECDGLGGEARRTGRGRYHRHQYGVPAKRVAGGLAGSALMRDLDHAVRIVGAVVGRWIASYAEMPLGWDES